MDNNCIYRVQICKKKKDNLYLLLRILSDVSRVLLSHEKSLFFCEIFRKSQKMLSVYVFVVVFVFLCLWFSFSEKITGFLSKCC